MKAQECKKCKRRHKLLTDEGLCFFCDQEGWYKRYPAGKKEGQMKNKNKNKKAKK